jgi:CelD/BcsL family acetyltransferase involved in cellulose biosynthesis
LLGLIDNSRRLIPIPGLARTECPPRLVLTEFDSFEAARTIRDEWDRFAERIGGDVFATFDWCAVWWRHFSSGRTLRIYTARRDRELVAVIPVFREAIRWGPVCIHVVRVVGTDHAGTRCCALFDPAICDELATALFEALNRDGVWDVFHIGDLPGYFMHAREFAAALQRAAKCHRVYLRDGYCPHAVFEVPDDFESFLSRLSGNERKNIRKTERRLTESVALRTFCVSREDLPFAFEELCRWHRDHWQARGELGFIDKWPGAHAFHADIAAAQADAGRLRLLRLRAGEQTIGYIYAQRFGGRLHLFQSVRAPDVHWDRFSPGRLLHCAAMRTAIDERLSQVDAMSGFYEYKRRLGADFLRLKCVTAVHRRWSSRIRVGVFRAITAMIHLVYFRMWFSKLAPFLRRRLSEKSPRFLYAGMSRRHIRSRFVLDAFSGRSFEINVADRPGE